MMHCSKLQNQGCGQFSMTTFTMVFGMTPIALSSAAGSEWKSGLAMAIIGGLLSSLFLTLIVVSRCLYESG